jgi:hypothetical protein
MGVARIRQCRHPRAVDLAGAVPEGLAVFSRTGEAIYRRRADAAFRRARRDRRARPLPLLRLHVSIAIRLLVTGSTRLSNRKTEALLGDVHPGD